MKPILAVTGGIGSGKSYVVGIFSALGIPVYDADTRTKELYVEKASLLKTLREILGPDLVRNGELDREYMSRRIFTDKSLLSAVESAVFPYVLEDIASWRNAHEKEDSPFLILESAIFLEKPVFSGTADRILTVSSPEEIRIGRVMSRNRVPRQQVLQRMKNQCTDAEREAASDFIILSDFRHPLLPQVLEVCAKMKES